MANPTPTIDFTLGIFALTLRQVGEMVADIPESRLAEQPGGLVNHPAWTLAHLCTAAGAILKLLDEPCADFTDAEARAFGPGSTPIADLGEYESRATLLARLADRHARAEKAVRAKHAEYFDRPTPESLQKFAPTVGRLVMYLLSAHESYHLGQLSQWKRAALKS